MKHDNFAKKDLCRHPEISTVPQTSSKIVCFLTWRETAQLRVPDVVQLPDHAKPVLKIEQ